MRAQDRLRDKNLSISWNIHQSISGTVPSFRVGETARTISHRMRFIRQINDAGSMPEGELEVRYVSTWRGSYEQLIKLVQSCVTARTDGAAVTDALIDGLFMSMEPNGQWTTCWWRPER